MRVHDFAPLLSKYPEVIAEMPEHFGSHEFILRLAQKYQGLYVDALYSYRNVRRNGKPVPFMFVHQVLSNGLSRFPDLVEPAGRLESHDIWGQSNSCARWRKVEGI